MIASRPGISLLVAVSLGFVVLFGSAALHHELFQSRLFDLGIFDQGVYLISRGEFPFSTTMGFHILGDHAAVVLYPLALLYRLVPGVYWLFFVQALSLSLGAMPMYGLAAQAGLEEHWRRVAAVAYLLYPALFNIAIFDFHPEVIALPAILWALWAALARRPVQLTIATLLVLSCKEVLGLTVAAMGLWLLLKNRRRYGVALTAVGLAWFVFASQWVIPTFSGDQMQALGRYSYLGNSATEIVLRLVREPTLVLVRLVQPESLLYLVALLVPVAVALRWRLILSALPALPMLGLNLLSSLPLQRDLRFQYQLPIFPFLLFWFVVSLKAEKNNEFLTGRPLQIALAIAGALLVVPSQFRVLAVLALAVWLGFVLRQGRRITPKILMGWLVIGFCTQARFTSFFSPQMSHLANLAQIREAIALVDATGGVLTTSDIAPHLSERRTIEMFRKTTPLDLALLPAYRYVLLDLLNPGTECDAPYLIALQNKLRTEPHFKQVYAKNRIALFIKHSK